jgi:hypothetical protein
MPSPWVDDLGGLVIGCRMKHTDTTHPGPSFKKKRIDILMLFLGIFAMEQHGK